MERSISNIGKRPYHSQRMLSKSFNQDEYNQKLGGEENKKVYIEIGRKNFTDKYTEYPII